MNIHMQAHMYILCGGKNESTAVPFGYMHTYICYAEHGQNVELQNCVFFNGVKE